MDDLVSTLPKCAKDSCECCGYKKIKVRIDGKTRKLKVYRANVLKSIKSVIGALNYISYIDDDNDKVCCYTEKEATMAIFDDNVTSFLIERSVDGTGNLKNGDTVVAKRKVDEGDDNVANDTLNDAHAESCGNDTSMSTITFVSTYVRESRIEGCAKKNDSLQKACEALSKEHFCFYGIECLFTLKIRERGPTVTCSICEAKLNATNVRSNIKSHFLGSQTHIDNVLAITSKADEMQRLIVSVKRYIYSKELENEICVEDNSSDSTETCIRCLLCVPSSFVSLTGLEGSFVGRIEAHLKSRSHKSAKMRRKLEIRSKREKPAPHKEHV